MIGAGGHSLSIDHEDSVSATGKWPKRVNESSQFETKIFVLFAFSFELFLKEN